MPLFSCGKPKVGAGVLVAKDCVGAGVAVMLLCCVGCSGKPKVGASVLVAKECVGAAVPGAANGDDEVLLCPKGCGWCENWLGMLGFCRGWPNAG